MEFSRRNTLRVRAHFLLSPVSKSAVSDVYAVVQCTITIDKYSRQCSVAVVIIYLVTWFDLVSTNIKKSDRCRGNLLKAFK